MVCSNLGFSSYIVNGKKNQDRSILWRSGGSQFHSRSAVELIYKTHLIKRREKMVKSCTDPIALLYLYKNQLRLKMKERSLPYLQWVLAFQPFKKRISYFHSRRSLASLTILYPYSYGKCSDEIHYWISPFSSRSTYQKEFHADSIFQTIATLRNTLPHIYFSEHQACSMITLQNRYSYDHRS